MPASHESSQLVGLQRLFDSTLKADAASIDSGATAFSTDFSDLRIVFLGRTTEAVDRSTILVRLNNDSGANYDRQAIRGANATASAFIGLAGTSWVLTAPGANQQAGAAGTIEIYIPSYGQVTFHKCGNALVGCTDDTAANLSMDALAVRWQNTAAITRVAISAGSGNLLTGSRLAVYGIG